ncbi:MAG: hypothetical protein ACXVXJ_13260, partial [Mycobacteriaceae bacterium]
GSGGTWPASSSSRSGPRGSANGSAAAEHRAHRGVTSSGFGRKYEHTLTGCRGYRSGTSGQRMNVLRPVWTYRGGAAQR